MTRHRPEPVQVEQLFNDGTHPAIAEPLFAGAYGEQPAPAAPAAAECAGQLALTSAAWLEARG